MQKKVHAKSRRGNAVAMVAIGMPVLLGFAALSIDMGMLYSARADLQRTADAAALAAALQLGDNTDGNALARAKQSVTNLSAQNKVLGQPLQVDLSTDFVLGQAAMNVQTGQYTFTVTNSLPNAVKVQARRTTGSPSGPVPLAFANIFGKSTANVSASAIGVLTPRDLVFVLDLSGSHNDNSCLQSCKNMVIDNRNVWAYMWDTLTGLQPYQNGYPLGPSFGNMNTWGDLTTGPNGINVNDPGLGYLPRSTNWNLTSAAVSQTLNAAGYGNYTASELAVINNSAYDSDVNYYNRRVMVALGLVRWKSGLAGGQAGGNNNTKIDSTEVTQALVAYPSSASNPTTHSVDVGGSWTNYIAYVTSSTSPMSTYDPNSYTYGDPNCRYRFGLKTFVDYLQTNQAGASVSPGLNGAPEQPMGAVSDGVKTAIGIIEGLQSNDQVGMAAFGTYGYGPGNYPNNLSWLTTDLNSVNNKVNTLQASMWTSTTNTSQGIDKGVDVLFNSPTARKFATKVLILLTDGRPNQTRASNTQYIQDMRGVTNTVPYTDATAAAQDAANKGVIIYTIGVGAVTTETALQAWLANLATIGHGNSYVASGDIATYHAQLQTILKALGGKRPVVLVQ